MKCSFCAKPAKYMTSVITPKETKQFCSAPKCKKARLELEKYLKAKRAA